MLAHRGAASSAVARPVRPQRAATVAVRASGSAVQTLSVPVKSASSGAAAGTAELSLKVAGEDTAKGLVHRYLVYILQNARRVRSLGAARFGLVLRASARARERGAAAPPPPSAAFEWSRRGSTLAPLPTAARPPGAAVRCGARQHWRSTGVLRPSRGSSGCRARACVDAEGADLFLLSSFSTPLPLSLSPEHFPSVDHPPHTHKTHPPPPVLQNQPSNQTQKQQGTACTLTRSDVRGGGKKPYKQKGTGGARRGSSTSPLFPGGGVTFGPKPKDWSIKMNKKERRLALGTALASAAGDMTVVDSLAEVAADGKTKALVAALAGMGASPMDKKVLLIAAEAHEHVMRAGGNVERLAINTADAVQAFDVLNSEAIVIERAALEKIAAALGGAGDA